MNNLIWAACGKHWGYRFLLDGGYRDPLPHYERSFANVPDDGASTRRLGDEVALRLLDPLGRRDAAGRIITHDFVVMGPSAAQIDSVEDGLEKIWPLVEDAYAQVWDADRAPNTDAIRAHIASTITGIDAQAEG